MLLNTAKTLAARMNSWLYLINVNGQLRWGSKLWIKPNFASRLGVLGPNDKPEGSLLTTLEQMSSTLSYLNQDNDGYSLTDVLTKLVELERKVLRLEVNLSRLSAEQASSQSIMVYLQDSQRQLHGRYHTHTTQEITADVVSRERWPID